MALTPLPPLGCLLAFEASARHLSFTRAGNELHLSPSAVSRQISQLEEFLGRRLFSREHNALRLTPAGETYAIDVRSILELCSSATSNMMARVVKSPRHTQRRHGSGARSFSCRHATSRDLRDRDWQRPRVVRFLRVCILCRHHRQAVFSGGQRNDVTAACAGHIRCWLCDAAVGRHSIRHLCRPRRPKARVVACNAAHGVGFRNHCVRTDVPIHRYSCSVPDRARSIAARDFRRW